MEKKKGIAIGCLEYESTKMMEYCLEQLDSNNHRRIISVETVKRFLRKPIYRVWLEYTSK